VDWPCSTSADPATTQGGHCVRTFLIRHVQRLCSFGSRRTGLPMTTTNKHRPALETIGKVRILDRCSKGYFRLKWPEPDGTGGDTSGGPTMETARAKATQINARFDLAVGPLAMMSLRDAVDLFIKEGGSPYPHKRSKSPSCGSPPSSTTCARLSTAACTVTRTGAAWTSTWTGRWSTRCAPKAGPQRRAAEPIHGQVTHVVPHALIRWLGFRVYSVQKLLRHARGRYGRRAVASIRSKHSSFAG
jgi:hypothetical protein